MATRLRKTRKLRGGRHMGWGQVAQHRASGHKGGLGRSGHMKHFWSIVIKEDQDHFGHKSSHTPQPNIIKKWASVRDLDDLYLQYGKEENGKKTLNLTLLGFDKLLGGGQVKNAYTITVKQTTKSAIEKVKQSNGEIIGIIQKIKETPKETPEEPPEEKIDSTNNDG